ncbi:basal cell adhesion molecule [Arapaima gigas]
MRAVRTWALCWLLLSAAPAGCRGSVTVTVSSKMEVIKGDSITLPCSFVVPSNLGNSIIEWFIDEGGSRKRVAFRTLSGSNSGADNGTRLSGRVSIGEENSLFISSVHVEDERRYHCQVTAGPSGAGEATTELKVFYPPEKPVVTASNQVISVLESTTSEAGQCVSRNGFPVPRLIWYKNSMPLPEVKDSKEKMYMAHSQVKEASGLYTVTSTLYLQPTKEDRNAEFKCTVEYQMPNDKIMKLDSESFTLKLHYPTEHVTFSLETMGSVKEGDDVKMICKADGSPQPAFEFSFSDKENRDFSKEGSNGVLTLRSVTRANSGIYQCEALDFDAQGVDLIRKLELFVHYLDPVKIMPHGPVNVLLGEKVELRCKTKGSDMHTMQWMKGTTILSKTEVLTLPSVSYADTGIYSCVSSVPSVPGLHAQGNVTVTVSGKPMIATPTEVNVQKLGDTVTLACSAQGHPAPQFTWTSSGKEAVTIHENSVVSKLTVEATESILKSGVICKAANEHGNDSKRFNLTLSSAQLTVSLTLATFSTHPSVVRPLSFIPATADRQQGGSTGVVVAVVVCVLLLLLLVAMLYCLQRKGKLPCGKQDKKEVATGEVNNDIVVEMKSEKAHEEAELLNKRPPTEQ